MSLNCATIMGRLTANPELRTTNSGLAVTSFTVAVDRSYAKQGEERQAEKRKRMKLNLNHPSRRISLNFRPRPLMTIYRFSF